MMYSIVLLALSAVALGAPTKPSHGPERCEVGSKNQYVRAAGNALAPHGLQGQVQLSEQEDGGFQVNQISTMAETERAIREHASVIMFHAQWCPHCKRMKPVFKQVAESSAPLGIWFHMVDADTYRDIGNAFGVNGYPTIKYYSARRGTTKDNAVEYEGGPNVDEFERFVNQQHSLAYANYA